ncbi:uridine kinase [Alteromonadaceae bacterium M269]|nr:uridine kinase [Alteromonadaceae bacterium M269]
MMSTSVIAISGGSGSGKSLFTSTLKNELLATGADILVLCEDHYYRDQAHLSMSEREKTNYDHPNAFEHSLLQHHVEQLKAGESIEYPQYCHKTHTRLDSIETVAPASVIIVEGIMLLAARELQSLFDIKVFIDTPLDICLLRRFNRDIKERARTIESVSAQYEQTVKPMYHQFIEPSRFLADVVVTQGGKNRIALDIIKSHIQQILN